jgi:DNA-binding response OmpR family regulator
MEAGIRIAIVAPPGHTRESLLALLRTLHPLELFPLDPAEQLAWQAAVDAALQGPAIFPETLAHTAVAPAVPDLALIDLVGLGRSGDELLASLRRRWPAVRLLALVETLRLAGGAHQGADCVLHRSVAAGDLLTAVQQLARSRSGCYQPGFAVQTGLSSGRKLL